jgi:hypothetical protein
MYYDGTIDIDQAISTVSLTKGVGELWAGELYIEKASKSRPTDLKTIVTNLENAQELFKRSRTNELKATSGKPNEIVALARVYEAHLPIYASIFTQSLPDEQLARSVYEKTIKIGYDLAQQPTEVEPNKRRKINLCLAKIAIEALLQRYTISQSMTRYWFPMIVTLSPRIESKVSTDANEIVDIELLEDHALYGLEVKADNNPIQVAYNIHVNPRSLRPLEEHEVLDELGLFLPPNIFMRKVDISPDLIIPDTRPSHITSDIIEDCVMESFYPVQSVKTLATARLNARTDRLLETLDRTN